MQISAVKGELIKRAESYVQEEVPVRTLEPGNYRIYGQSEEHAEENTKKNAMMLRYQSPDGTVAGYKAGAGGESWFIQSKEESTMLHRHDYIELGYVLEGTAVQSFSGREHAFRQGELWISDRSCIHSDCLTDQELFTLILIIPEKYFDQEFFKSLEDERMRMFFYNALRQQEQIKQFLHFIPERDALKKELFWTEDYAGKEEKTGQNVLKLLELLLQELTEREPGWYQVVNGLTLRLISILMSRFSVQFVNQQKMKIRNIVYQEMAAYIKEHYASVTRREISTYFHYSEDFIGKIIKENSGLTFQKFLQEVRLKEAVRCLRETDLPVDRIISEIGYQNRGYFYRIFMEKYGCTPSEWRKRGINE